MSNYLPDREMPVATYVKAIVGAAIAGLTALGTALIADGVSPIEWVGVATAVLLTFPGVYRAANKTTTRTS